MKASGRTSDRSYLMSEKNRNRSVVTALAALLLVACGSEQKPAEPMPVQDTVFGDSAGAMDKARAVEGTMKQHKEGLDHALQEQENPTAE
jgi:hypothetical protein